MMLDSSNALYEPPNYGKKNMSVRYCFVDMCGSGGYMQKNYWNDYHEFNVKLTDKIWLHWQGNRLVQHTVTPRAAFGTHNLLSSARNAIRIQAASSKAIILHIIFLYRSFNSSLKRIASFQCRHQSSHGLSLDY